MTAVFCGGGYQRSEWLQYSTQNDLLSEKTEHVTRTQKEEAAASEEAPAPAKRSKAATVTCSKN